MKTTLKTATALVALAASPALAGDFAETHYTTPLADVCPSPLIIQKDWLAQAEQGPIYQMIGAGGEMVSGQYTGPLGSTGIDLTILEGGGGIGLGDGETAYSALFTGNSKAGVMPHLGYQELDNAFIFSKRFPVTGIFAPLDAAPTSLFWDEATYPDGFSSIEDLAALEGTDAKIYVSTIKRTFGLYLAENGVPSDLFVEGYRGDLENFVTNNGAWLNQGFVTSEPYKLENGMNWAKPINALLINDLGYGNYTGMLSVATSRMDELSPCFEKLVPIMQQATVDYAKDPTEVNQLILEFLDAGMAVGWWTSTPELMTYASETMVDLGILGNGSNETIGDFDMDRVASILEIVAPQFDERADPEVTPGMIVTNKFIDPSIGLE
ncbi:hypothetical protein TG4357_00808 [Thalassovita gelatinovora]|uniref:ABC transporter substrate-binding protein n=1 Tax=Thalassovita gelatinovora TaxID=53501 RepID=A0A0P1F6S9_THAGE|nr:hypothetical protein [Thalassovita gelatinovora]QIZ79182.1 hypothetical protein HFZ77_01185 [Thalassovita gelatinovora]CUH63655.1 hypothetical protein TG4357_00808 [Thalassovita gelatinovora]SER01023.1 hypothetical protein SAMN04488043_11349 [Thalassovita gelatinovora]